MEVPLKLGQRIGAAGPDDELILQLVDQGDFVRVLGIEHLDADADTQVLGVLDRTAVSIADGVQADNECKNGAGSAGRNVSSTLRQISR